jgi:diguanylate cyclase (GGDEF)-like protein
VVGILDIVTGSEIAFAIFYLVPVSTLAWFGGLQLGITFAVLSSFVWYIADYIEGTVYSHPFIAYWNTFSSLAFFVIIALILSRLKTALDQEKNLARTDHLTGTANSRAFSEIITSTIDAADRYHHPFTTIYMDIDNFKTVNDSLGHEAGDTVLASVANVLCKNVRILDTVARLGGDEFALLLPETGFEAAETVIVKLRKNLLELAEKNRWPISFSIGAVTHTKAPLSADEVIRLADAAMYRVKNTTKNAILHETANI